MTKKKNNKEQSIVDVMVTVRKIAETTMSVCRECKTTNMPIGVSAPVVKEGETDVNFYSLYRCKCGFNYKIITATLTTLKK